ncbi:MAG: hypothetical protein BRD55_01960 [Bacteroidetes bacterium SW_9_63_38]|nr:MAG: hypothetical protein BRD55_01960 [Bacteroidetes bacterium SW_9_63_38]
MQNVQKVILYLASAIGVWLLASFAGAMFDSANATLWSNSLMWAILSFLIVVPALALMNDFSFRKQKDASSSSEGKASTKVIDEDTTSFIQKDADSSQTLWPEPEQSEYSDWPQEQDADEYTNRVRA